MYVSMNTVNSCCRFLLNIFILLQTGHILGPAHYGLYRIGTVQWKLSMGKALIRDRDFLAPYVESRAIPWQFEFENVKYIMTCSMDTLLMTLFLLWHRGLIPLKALKNDPSPLAEIFKLIKIWQHAEARKKWLDYDLGLKTTEFFKSKQGDNPFDCTAGILHVVRNCSLFIFGEKQISEECSRCKHKGSVRNVLKSSGMFSTVRTDISCPQANILDGKGYNGKVSLVCQEHQAIPLEDKFENLNASHKKCGGTFLYELIIREPHPWILCVSSVSNIKHGHTGVGPYLHWSEIYKCEVCIIILVQLCLQTTVISAV